MKEYIIDIIDEMTESYYPEGIGINWLEDTTDKNIATVEGSLSETPIVLLSVSDIVSGLSEEFKKIESPSMKELFFSLFLSLQDNLVYYKSNFQETSHFPQIHIMLLEDNSIFIEWIFYDFRIGFSIEEEIGRSSWYLISNEKFNNLTKSGFLNKENINSIVSDLLGFVFKNT